MATNPSSPGGNSPVPGSGGNGSGLPSKPRATIVLKNQNAKTGSSPVITPATPAKVNSQRLPAVRPSVVGPAGQSARRPAVNIQMDREALGLSAARPSEMVAGLDEAVKRAEASAAREEAKRKAGGKINLNVAVHVDDTGRKWTRLVQLGIAVVFVVAGIAGALMWYGANHKTLDPRRALAETRASLSDLEMTAKKIEKFEAGESVTAPAVKTRMQKVLEAQLDGIKKSLQRDQQAARMPDKALVAKRMELEKLIQFKDGWDAPFEFTVNGNELAIRSVTKADGVPSEPVKVNLRPASDSVTEKKDK